MELTDFYRQNRPEYFSDSSIEVEHNLPREILDYQLDQISVNQKQDEFETMVRRLLERFITPNLIPQVGPTGGGDGKTDSETYTVSRFVSERWFIPDNDWKGDEKWAFAISAKKDWLAKIKSDVSNIINTNRGYTKIFFITNQKPSSKKKKDLQDKLLQEHGVDVEILDREWILSKIYDGQALNIAVESLNLSDSYRQVKKTGPRDAQREKELEELERHISDTNRYFEYDYQLVDDAIQAAILSRMLERPKDEVIGRFDRALRFSEKLKIGKLSLKIYYQRAWTHIHWYNDVRLFIEDYKVAKSYISDSSSIKEFELINNLYNVLNGQLHANPEYASFIDIEEESRWIDNVLLAFIQDDKTRPSSSLIARSLKIIKDVTAILLNEVENSLINPLLIELKEIFIKARYNLDYPFESYSKIIEFYGAIIPDIYEYEELVDVMADISSKRNSDISAAEIFLKRGLQKYKAQLYDESVIYFGKAVLKLAKEESEELFYLTLRGLSDSYEELGLSYGSYCSHIAATSIAFKEWGNSGFITEKMFNCICQLANLELISGRIPQFLSYYEILHTLAPMLNISEEDYAEKVMKYDFLLAVRLLNTKSQQSGFSLMPDILNNHGLLVSAASSFYKLGYVENAKRIIEGIALFKDYDGIEDIMHKIAQQPAAEQMSNETNLYYSEIIQLCTTILGCSIVFYVPKDKELILRTECILAYIESFFATSWSHLAPTTDEVKIQLVQDVKYEKISICQRSEGFPEFDMTIPAEALTDEMWQSVHIEIFAHLMGFFMGNDLEGFVENLFKKDEVHERTGFLSAHLSFIHSIMGDSPKILLDDWMTKETQDYPLVQGWKYETEKVKPSFKKDTLKPTIKHTDISINSLINIALWDKAGWTGFATVSDKDWSFLAIVLGFKVDNMGIAIFEEWKTKIGNIDPDNKIKIAIIRGIDKENPFWYRIHIYSIPDENLMKNGQYYVTSSRMHTMTPDNSFNLDQLISLRSKHNKYWLCPAKINTETGTFAETPHFHHAIGKAHLEFVNAYEIGIGSMHRVAILDTDNPIIPEGMENPPVLELIEEMSKNKK